MWLCVSIEKVVDHDHLLVVITTVAVSPQSPHIQGLNAVRGCASTLREARVLGLGREEEVVARILTWWHVGAFIHS
jgi:hypothetical protein